MILIDSNVIIDIMTENPVWGEWSFNIVDSQLDTIAINPIIYAEISVKYEQMEPLDEAIQPFKRLDLPYEAAFLAGKAFLKYRTLGGKKETPLPDFFIGAHAAILDIPLITRDIHHYRAYFPRVKLIHPFS
ncbi:MAG: type II toxin-antitoxin system VapC family toxin [Alphaproteobacteria bacterium]|nr:type II toxin-antitoxin system VapC family toxin [Alphaproteobacteria bacterium]